MTMKFPHRPLNETLEISSAADPQDVLDVKIFLNQKGLYKIPDYGLTPYADVKMFEAIKSYQKQKNLTIDGVMKANGETQNRCKKTTPSNARNYRPQF